MYHEARASCVQPWGCNSVLSSSSTRSNSHNNNMMSTSTVLGSSLNGALDVGTHIEEDFLIEDLSDFSNDDIAAPINESELDFSSCSLRQYSDGRTSSPLHERVISKDDNQPCLSAFPCQDETGCDWLSSFGTPDDSLIYGASTIDADSFLLSSVEPFGGNGELAKLGDEGDESQARKDTKVGQNDDSAGGDIDEGDGGVWDKIMSMPITGGRAPRSKRARSAGWSSVSSTLCNSWSDYSSPSNSLDSTSNLSHQVIPTTATQSSCTFVREQEESHIEHVASNPNVVHFPSNPNIDVTASRGQLNSAIISKESYKMFSSHAPCSAKEEESGAEIVSNGGHTGLPPRRCTHCLSQKTPQWRAGPEGPKTLCNACGVRYKSGRLFDEYRPAKSPTFLSYKHSNSHKKVMEMRRRKAVQYQQHQRYGTTVNHAAGLGPAPSPSKKAWIEDHQLANKLKIRLHEGSTASEPYSHFSEVTLISSESNRAALLDSPARFLY